MSGPAPAPPATSSSLGVSLASRARGCLVGSAVGDAIGTTVEFMPPGSFEPVTDMKGGGKFKLQPGQVVH
jgi:ADP-ribosyl-[dinitrogen reductase] hydrolase